MEYLNAIFRYFGKVLSATFLQLTAIFGFFFLFGILLYFISRSTRKTYVNSYHWKLDVFVTGWIGTPVHELGHAIFCLIFGHRIREIKLYTPNSTDGSMGYVYHTYNPDNFYHNVGNFFIGLGPIIFGSFILYGLMYIMLPNFNEISSILSSGVIQNSGFLDAFSDLGSILKQGLRILGAIFSLSNFTTILFWIFLYLSFSIASHMQLSPPDLKSMLKGFITIIIIFLLINLTTVLFNFDFTGFIFSHSRFTGVIFGLFLYSLVISLVNFIITYLIVSIFFYMKYKRLPSII